MVGERIGSALQRAIHMGTAGLQVAAYMDGKLVADAWAGDTGLERHWRFTARYRRGDTRGNGELKTRRWPRRVGKLVW